MRKPERAMERSNDERSRLRGSSVEGIDSSCEKLRTDGRKPKEAKSKARDPDSVQAKLLRNELKSTHEKSQARRSTPMQTKPKTNMGASSQDMLFNSKPASD